MKPEPKKSYLKIFKNLINEIYFAVNNKDSQYCFKYVGRTHCNKLNHDVCVIQLRGKNIFAKVSANQIISNKKVRTEFSYEDIIAIAKIDEEIKRDLMINQYKIHAIQRQGIEEKDIFIIKCTGLESMRRVSSKDIIRDNILEKLNGRDGYEIGYIDAIKSVSSLKQEMENAKKNEEKKAYVVSL